MIDHGGDRLPREGRDLAMELDSAGAGAPVPASGDRTHPTDFHELFARSAAMFDGRPENSVLRLAMTSVPEIGRCRAEACYRWGSAGCEPVLAAGIEPPADVPLAEQLAALGARDGSVRLRHRGWAWAYVLRGAAGPLGFLVVGAATEPDRGRRSAVGLLAQQTGAALFSAAARRRDEERAGALRRAYAARQAANAQLTGVVVELEMQRLVHETLIRATVEAEGESGIARAVHQLTGLPVAVEDCFGNLHAWAGPGEPEPYARKNPLQRQRLLQEAAREHRPLRAKGRIIGLARYRGEILGLLSLIDPEYRAGEHEVFALEHACTVLALELAHQRNLAEVELRLRRELVDDLITGTDDASAIARSQAVGHDLRGPHHLAVVRWTGGISDDLLARAAAGACRTLELPALADRRSGLAVLVIAGGPRGDALYRTLAAALGSDTGAIGLSGVSHAPRELPRAYKEASRALQVREHARKRYGSTSFDQLGLYRILGTGDDHHEIEGFVREWLGLLLDYDGRHHGDLVPTLTRYFECGGNYDETAAALTIHRSTLRYRLQRIREISGSDLGDVEHRLNLQVATRVWQIMSG
jgi:sugar diacid utilization regulator